MRRLKFLGFESLLNLNISAIFANSAFDEFAPLIPFRVSRRFYTVFALKTSALLLASR